MRKLRILFLLVLLLGLFTVANGRSFAQQSTCPDGGEWTKVDSNDLSSYPVPGAVEYCFKAGSDNAQGCNGGLFSSWPQGEGTCGLSHWSYRIPPVVGDDDDDETPPPPGDDDDDETPPPPDDDDDDRTPPPPVVTPVPTDPPPGGPTPEGGCLPDGTYEMHLPGTFNWPAGTEFVDSRDCHPPEQPAEGQTGLFDEEELGENNLVLLAIAAGAVLLLVLLVWYSRSGSSE